MSMPLLIITRHHRFVNFHDRKIKKKIKLSGYENEYGYDTDTDTKI